MQDVSKTKPFKLKNAKTNMNLFNVMAKYNMWSYYYIVLYYRNSMFYGQKKVILES